MPLAAVFLHERTSLSLPTTELPYSANTGETGVPSKGIGGTRKNFKKYQWFLGSLAKLRKATIKLVIYRVFQEEWTKLREGVPYVKIYR